MLLIPKSIQRGFEALLSPVVQWLISRRVHPNVLTTAGTLILLASAVAFAAGRIHWGGFLLLLSGIFDMLDGRVAREGEVASKFGAFYDSTLDRVGEAALFGSIALFFATGGVPEGLTVPAVSISIVAMVSSLLVSYARARAEGLGLECTVGIAQRAERILGLGVPTLVFGAGRQGLLLLTIVSLLALVSLVTVVQRVYHVFNVTRRVPRKTQARMAAPALPETSRQRKKW